MTDHTPTHSDAYPDLDPGINLLQGPESRTTALHRIVISELRERDGIAYWLDARNNASTYTLTELADSHRLLSNVRIARAFTAYQHHALTRSLAQTIDGRTTLLVVPAIADLYRDDDIPEPDDEQYLSAAVRILAELGDILDIPVLASTRIDDDLTAIVADRAQQVIEYESTEFGYRYTADDFETLLYREETHWQTTIPYWVDLFGAVEAQTETAYELGLVEASV